jgi:chromosome segregation ATPase
MSQDKAIETTLNLSIDASQSQNFFSRLHQNQLTGDTGNKVQDTGVQVQDTGVQVQDTDVQVQDTGVQVQDTGDTDDQNIKTDTIDFLNKINSTEKIMGHNKFQQKIEELENELNIYKKYNNEQDMKINLFKKTISNLQTQLQEKSNQINVTQTSDTYMYTNKINTLTSDLAIKTQENNNLLQRIVILEKDIEYNNIDLEKIKGEYFDTIDKLKLLNQAYKTLELKYQEKVNDIQSNKTVINNLEKKLNLEITIKTNLELELNLLKGEVSEYRNNINNVKLEKDNEISVLTEQLNNISKSIEIKKEVKPINKQESIIGRPRGTNNTTRGANRTR